MLQKPNGLFRTFLGLNSPNPFFAEILKTKWKSRKAKQKQTQFREWEELQGSRLREFATNQNFPVGRKSICVKSWDDVTLHTIDILFHNLTENNSRKFAQWWRVKNEWILTSLLCERESYLSFPTIIMDREKASFKSKWCIILSQNISHFYSRVNFNPLIASLRRCRQ